MVSIELYTTRTPQNKQIFLVYMICKKILLHVCIFLFSAILITRPHMLAAFIISTLAYTANLFVTRIFFLSLL